MKKYLCILGMMILSMVMLSGCLHHVRMYSQDKPRVDQELPPGSDEAGRKKTRKILLVEITKDTPDAAKKAPSKEVSVKSGSEPQETSQSEKKMQEEKPVTETAERMQNETKSFGSMNFASTAQEKPKVGSFQPPVDLPTQYTIEKDDTLQTIAKKFYGSYGKWVKIYNANKDAIPDPNKIKPGTKITIPKL